MPNLVVTDTVVGVLGVGVVDPAGAVLRADDAGVLRGDGCFETVRVADAAAGRLDSLDAHLDRLAHSAARLELPPVDQPAWRALVAEVVAAWGRPGEARLRLVLTRGPDQPAGRPPVPTGFALLSGVPAETLRQRRDGVRVVTLSRGVPADGCAGAPWLLGGVKTISYAVNMAALRHARSVGADDVIFVATDGQVLEGPTATVLWAVGGALRTPPTGPAGLLDGITLRTVAEHLRRRGTAIETHRATVADLHAADGVWLVSSMRLVVPVTAIDGRPTRPPAGLTSALGTAAGL